MAVEQVLYTWNNRVKVHLSILETSAQAGCREGMLHRSKTEGQLAPRTRVVELSGFGWASKV